jgi:hypothetical protein
LALATKEFTYMPAPGVISNPSATIHACQQAHEKLAEQSCAGMTCST